ncbi:MAG: MFS transporter, partial [Anaerolineae bacterium]|nr:MFS transporter [Anaerolineae bacterium]
ALVGLVYWQWYFSVPVFMRDVHGMPAQYYGWMMSMAGVIVIVFQLAITRKLRGVGQHWVMAAGSVLFGIGFGMFGFISAYAMFLLASTVITFGEMVLFPTQQAIVARLAPEALRGRYIAAAGLAFALPNIFGPYLGGLALESVGPQSMWYLGALMCLVGTLGYLPLRGRLARAGDSSPE